MITMLNGREVAKLTGLSYSTVRKLATTPGAAFPPSVKIGRSRRWSYEHLQAWLEANMNTQPTRKEQLPSETKKAS